MSTSNEEIKKHLPYLMKCTLKWAWISKTTLSRVVAKFYKTESVRDLSRLGKLQINDDTKLNVLLEENSHATMTQVALQKFVS